MRVPTRAKARSCSTRTTRCLPASGRSIETEQGTLARHRKRKAEAETAVLAGRASRGASGRGRGTRHHAAGEQCAGAALRDAEAWLGVGAGPPRMGRRRTPHADRAAVRGRAAAAHPHRRGGCCPGGGGRGGPAGAACRRGALPPLQCGSEAGVRQQGPRQDDLPELEAALAWLERNRLSDHLGLLDGDPRYAWTATQRRRALWKQLHSQAGPEGDRQRSRT